MVVPKKPKVTYKKVHNYLRHRLALFGKYY